MLYAFPILFLFIAVIILLGINRFKPRFRYQWLILLTGGVVTFLGVLLWQVDYPLSLLLPPWQPIKVFHYSPAWLVDSLSWPYALSLAALAGAVILTANIRREQGSSSWSGILFLTLLGILAVTAADPLTLILMLTAIDLAELMFRILSAEGPDQTRAVILSFSIRVVGTGLLLWACVNDSSGIPALAWENSSTASGLFLFLASGLRLGILPLSLVLPNENTIGRGLGTIMRLVTASTGLSILAHIPGGALQASWAPYLLGCNAILAFFAGWRWFREPGDNQGRPYWILGLAALTSASTLYASPGGAVGWGVILILGGGLIFLFSSHHRKLMWLPLLGLWGMIAPPYSPTAGVWSGGSGISFFSLIILLPAQALLAAGFFRRIVQPGEISFESRENWVRILYAAGMLLLLGSILLLGVWGWDGAARIGLWWASVSVVFLTALVFFLSSRRLDAPKIIQAKVFRINILEEVFRSILRLLESIVRIITSTLEGEGGIFWSILLLVLILSLLSLGGG